jgi:SAM-dependent methyltransferase
LTFDARPIALSGKELTTPGAAPDGAEPMSHFLEEAEHLERQAAGGRVAYFQSLIGSRGDLPGPLLDVGCGNGYGVECWRAGGVRAFGLDRSLYRMGRWAAEHGEAPPMVVGDAAQLPFATSSLAVVVSSGMIEHVGVAETANPYTITPAPDQESSRSAVIAELGRVTSPSGALIVDCPNGAFPIDFWHGDRLGAFRLHRVPDTLLPTHHQLLRWGRITGLSGRLQPLGQRLRFRQIRSRWWGRVLSPFVAAGLFCCDRLIRTPLGPLVAWLYPYIVVAYEKPESADGAARP